LGGAGASKALAPADPHPRGGPADKGPSASLPPRCLASGPFSAVRVSAMTSPALRSAAVVGTPHHGPRAA